MTSIQNQEAEASAFRHPRPFLWIALLSLGALWPFAAANALEPIQTGYFDSTAVKGYDTVAYFTEGKPVKGDKGITHTWKGAEWRFSSAENRALFVEDPEKYAPQYGGYCAWAVSQGSTAGIDPKSWKIVDDKLYLNYSKKIQAKWEKDVPGNIQAADGHWPKLLKE